METCVELYKSVYVSGYIGCRIVLHLVKVVKSFKENGEVLVGVGVRSLDCYVGNKTKKIGI